MDTSNINSFQNILIEFELNNNLFSTISLSDLLLDCIINFSDNRNNFIDFLELYITNILNIYKPNIYMNTEQIVNLSYELSNYATIYSESTIYTNTYNIICTSINNLILMHPNTQMNWTLNPPNYND